MKSSNDLIQLNLFSEAPPAPAVDAVEIILKEARKRHLWGKAIKFTITASFMAVFIVVLLAFLILDHYHAEAQKTIKQGDAVISSIENNDRLREKRRREVQAKYQEALKRGDKNAVQPDMLGLEALGEELDAGFGKAMVTTFIVFDGFFASLLFVLLLFLLVPLILFTYFFLPAIVSSPFSLYLSDSWTNPYNIVLLRPFSRKETSNSLKKLVRNGLSGLGFFYTLADSQIKPKWYVKYPVLLGQLSLFQFRFRKIKSEKSVKKIPVLLGRKWRRVFNWSVSRNKIFSLTCADDYWQDSIRELFSCADIILIDLSGFHSNVLWEIEECQRLNILQRVIFIANSEAQHHLVKSLKKSEFNFAKDIIFYSDRTMLDIQRILYQIACRIPNLEKNK